MNFKSPGVVKRSDAQGGGIRPVMRVDAREPGISAINAAAAQFLGIPEDNPDAISASMPALATIRAFVELGPRDRPWRASLLFWTPSGPVARDADLQWRLVDGRDVVEIGFDEQCGGAAVSHEPALEPPAKRAQSDDLATMREIARRIRSGTKTPEKPIVTSSGVTIGTPQLDFEPQTYITEQKRSEQMPRDEAAIAGLARLVHELRTPLSAIASLAEVMRDERLGALENPRYRDYAGDIHDTAQHTLELVTAMLETAEGQRSNLIASDVGAEPGITKKTLDINDIARSSVSSMQPIAERGGVRLGFIGGNVSAIFADRRAVRQIILNIVSNALRFTPPGGDIKVETSQAASDKVTLSVSDTGSGIQSADLARALSPTDLHPIASPVPRIRLAGVHQGIGLPLVRQLIAAHGGSVAIESSPASGTRVTLTFPVSPDGGATT